MRILLQQVSSGRFLSESGVWTAQQSEAKEFDHFLEALVFARDCIPEPVGAYCVFRDPSYNFSVYLRDKSAAMYWESQVRPIEHTDQLQAHAHSC
jgi:hypothetical protein